MKEISLRLVFDDAHVAEGAIRDNFTLRISPSTDLYREVIKLYRPHFGNTIGESKLHDIARGNPTTLLFVPMYMVWKHDKSSDRFSQMLELNIDNNMKYPWFYLADHLSHCCVLISSSGIEISPPVIPLHSLPYFGSEVRRVYLTATLPSEAAFARSFGLLKPSVVRPKGKSGDAQRLFVFAGGDTDKAQRDFALNLRDGRKACIISPSKKKAEQWSPPAAVFDKESGHDRIEAFSSTKQPELLGLVARYDGIDLPGDACRILVLDRLPKGEALFERFIDEGIRVDAIRLGHTATRIVQAIGRIFRSNTDHGAVILVGTDLLDWIRNPSNRSYLTDLLQQQLALGLELAKQVASGQVTWLELLNGVLTGDEDWDELYDSHISEFTIQKRTAADDWYPEMLLQERKGYAAIWDGKYAEAISTLSNLGDRAELNDLRLSAWYRHLEGVAHLCASDQQKAIPAFIAASRIRIELGRPSAPRDRMFKPPHVDAPSFQSRALATAFRKKRLNALSSVDTILAGLVYGNRVSEAEEAMRVLGELLGLESTRPDSSIGTGPDNLWCGEGDLESWGFELKTGKAVGSEYTKAEIGQIARPYGLA